MPLIHKPGTAWEDGYARCRETAPEAFHDDRVVTYRARLVHTVVDGHTDEQRYGNFPTHAHYPEV